MGHRIGMAVVCLHISAVLYLIAGGALMFLFMQMDEESGLYVGLGFLAFCLLLIVGIEFVASGLRRRKFWAWIAGLCIFAIYLPSAFFPLGGLGLWGLLDSGSRREFGVGS